MISLPLIHKHKVNRDYLPLLLTLAIFTLLVRLFKLTDTILVILTLVLSLTYVFWGIIHHKKSGHIDKKIVLEYSSIAILVNIIIITLVS